MWDLITVSDGTTRQLQWTSRVEGDIAATNSTRKPLPLPSPPPPILTFTDPYLSPSSADAMTISQYLGRGQVSRGRATITSSLDMTVSTQPFFHDVGGGDREAVVQGIRNMQAALAGVAGLEWVRPLGNQSAEDYVDSLLVTANGRRSNHWVGTARLGADDGRAENGTTGAVVDLDTRVYGTDNIFVVDASIFPGQLTGNPAATIVTAAEHAVDRILALRSATARS